MSDCLHEQLRHDHYQVNTENPQAPVFDVIRCRQCNQFLAAFPLDRQYGSMLAIASGLKGMEKTLLTIDRQLRQRPKLASSGFKGMQRTLVAIEKLLRKRPKSSAKR